MKYLQTKIYGWEENPEELIFITNHALHCLTLSSRYRPVALNTIYRKVFIVCQRARPRMILTGAAALLDSCKGRNVLI